MTERLEVVVNGAGLAGATMSYALKQFGLDHVVFERNCICETWRTRRWDSFRNSLRSWRVGLDTDPAARSPQDQQIVLLNREVINADHR